MSQESPLIGSGKSLPELTVKAIILSIVLTVVLAAANAYLGLKLGITVSASIPAAVISMGVLRFFKNSNVLENNIVQTCASVGEALTAGIAFVLPALLLLHYWTHFDYLKTVAIALAGGLLGVLFSIPLRRALLQDKTLRFPEGTAIGNVLKSSAESKSDLSSLVKGGVIGSIIAFCQGGFEILASGMQSWFKIGNNVYGFGLGFSPALMAAGYIVGVNVCISIFVGVVIGWFAGVPVLDWFYHVGQTPLAAKSAETIARTIWTEHVRFIGVGTMLVGGLWTLVTLAKSVIKGVGSSFVALKQVRRVGHAGIPRVERDIPINYVGWCLLILLSLIGLLLFNLMDHNKLPLTQAMHWTVAGVSVLYVAIGGFIIASISGYFAGLVGSSNNPVSGLSVSALLIIGLILYPFLMPGSKPESASAICIIIVAIIACSTAIANDTIQDLKAGQMVGATPWKQQAMLILGAVVASLVVPEILQLLQNAYGIGTLPEYCQHASAVAGTGKCNPAQVLAAPQATLMEAVAKGAFSHNLPWGTIGVGAIVAVIGIIVDEVVKHRGQRFPVLALGLGIYLPLTNSTPLIFGGVTSYLVHRYMRKRKAAGKITDQQSRAGQQNVLLLACGIVAGAAVMGVLLAIPFSIAQNADVLSLVGKNFKPVGEAISLIVTLLVCYWMFRTATSTAKSAK